MCDIPKEGVCDQDYTEDRERPLELSLGKWLFFHTFFVKALPTVNKIMGSCGCAGLKEHTILRRYSGVPRLGNIFHPDLHTQEDEKYVQKVDPKM